MHGLSHLILLAKAGHRVSLELRAGAVDSMFLVRKISQSPGRRRGNGGGGGGRRTGAIISVNDIDEEVIELTECIREEMDMVLG